jgi:DNA (cytosine-5)-methyltransferase 1
VDRSSPGIARVNELIVDNFAGGGGASTGIAIAVGRDVDIAINHDPEALAVHAVNHPGTRHLCEDVFDVDPVAACAGQPVGLAWFSPDCKHFSKAKGGKPKCKKIRGLAWVMVKWAAKVRPRVMVLENVEEFKTWGPLLADGKTCPERKGRTFLNFVARLRNLGYAVDHRELRACDYGAPTIRKRLFLVARCDGVPIAWPAPTHGDPKSEAVRSGRLKPWRTAAECIDWSIPCPSIFERNRPLAEATMRRIARGIRKFVIESAEPFIVNVANSKTTGRGPNAWSKDEPLRTITSSPGFTVAVPHITKFRTGSVGSALNEPLPTVTAGPQLNPAGAAHALGLVSATVAPFLTEHANASGQRIFPENEPLRTQCGEVKGGHFAQVSAFLAKHYGGNETPGSPLSRPVDTITSKDHNALITANLMVNTSGHSGGATVEPLHTIATGGHHGLVTSHLSKLYGTTTGQPADEPMHTVTGGGNHIAEVRAFLIKYYGNETEAVDIYGPMHTVTAKDRIGLVAIHGEEYVITDIGMRMLDPRELYAAQGFPSDYVIAPIVLGRKLPKHARVRMCGNSVCPPVAAAVVGANYCPELKEELAA